MTLITSFAIDQSFFLLGDLLISGPEQEDMNLHLPSIGEVTKVFPKGSGFVPVKLTRKVCNFSNVAVAWAGQYIAAKAIIKQLYEETQKNGPISYEKIGFILSNLDPWLRKVVNSGEVSLLGYVTHPYAEDKGFGINIFHLKSLLLDDVRFSGSGGQLFQDYFDHRTLPEIKEKGVESTVMRALMIGGMLLQIEIGTFKTIYEYFGGGYELIILKDKRFILCDDMINIFWYAQVNDTETTISPVMKFFKQSYSQDILIIRTLEMSSPNPSDPMHLVERKDEVHYLPPIYRELTQKEKSKLSPPDLKASLLCSYILVQSRKGIEVLAKFDFSKNRELPLRFVDDSQNMRVEFKKNYFADIFNELERRAKSTKARDS